MKSLKHLTLLFILTFCNCKAQSNSINSSEATINGYNVFKATSQFLFQNFGSPNSIEDYFYEMEDENGKIYHYNDISFDIVKDKVFSFTITGSNIEFSTNKFHVGDNINVLESFYPISYSKRKDNAVVLQVNDIDCAIIFSYNSSGVITKIETHIP